MRIYNVILCPTIVLTASLLLACSKSSDADSDILLMPDVTTLGIMKPIAKFSFSYSNDDDTDEYFYRYSTDNRVKSFSSNEWSLSSSQLAFVSTRRALRNFLLNEAGCAVYFEYVADGVVCGKYQMSYDASNCLVSVKHEDVLGETIYTITRSDDGKIIETQNSDQNGKFLELCKYSYDSSAVYNSDGIFIIPLISEYAFLAPTGLLGCPEKYLPVGCTSIEPSNNGILTMYAKYDYDIYNSHVRSVRETWTWPDEGLQWTFFTSFLYKGLYD